VAPDSAANDVDNGLKNLGDGVPGRELASAAQVAAARRLGMAGRLRIAAEMSEDARLISIGGERRRHPELSDAEARDRVLRRLWGADLAARVPETTPSHR
jgi:hypothetical protein